MRSVLICESFFENDTNSCFRDSVMCAQMPLNPRFQEATLTVFEVGYKRSRRKYQRAARTLQIQASGFEREHGVEGFDFGYQFHE
jgi:hypothetical protein